MFTHEYTLSDSVEISSCEYTKTIIHLRHSKYCWIIPNYSTILTSPSANNFWMYRVGLPLSDPKLFTTLIVINLIEHYNELIVKMLQWMKWRLLGEWRLLGHYIAEKYSSTPTICLQLYSALIWNRITANVTDKGSRWVLKALHNFHQIVPNGEAYFSVTVTCDETYTCGAQMQPLWI